MKLYPMLKSLDFERMTGTAGEERGIQVIAGHLKKMGFEPKVETFEFEGFDPGTATISDGEKSFEATPYGLCPDVSVSGKLIYLENLDAIKYNPGAYDDAIVLFYHSDSRLYSLSKLAKVKAFIGISAPFKSAYSYSHRQNLPAEESFPIAMMRYDDAEKLIKKAGKTVSLTIKQKVEKRIGHNIVLDIEGSGKDDSLTLLVGHYDTVARSHGACDNAAGSVCMIKAIEQFKKKPPLRDLRVIWFSGEELGLLGSYAYVKQHEEELKKRCKLVVNVDLAGDPIGRNVLFCLGTKELKGYASGILKEAGLLFSDKLSLYSSDCIPFSVHEIPSLNLARVGGKALYHGHTDQDVAKHCSEQGLTDVYLATKTILSRVLNAEMYPVAEGIDDSLRENLERYLWHSTLEKPELKWTEKYKK